MITLERIGLQGLHRMDPEAAHGLALRALRFGLAPAPGRLTSDRLRCDVAGLRLPNPVGLAAGFDKNAVALRGLARAGFGFVEVGAATPRPQAGNPRPRLFRLDGDRAAINRNGFANDGMAAIGARLALRPRGAVIGLNLGAGKDSPDKAGDFARVLAHCGAHVDFATVNVSSPNTAGLRDLQAAGALRALLADVLQVRGALARRVPVLLKIAPDLTPDQIGEMADIALGLGIDGIVATNTTLGRDGVTDMQAHEAGGLSGAPLFARATQVVAQLSQASQGRIALIGVGGIGSAQDAYDKIRAGASAVQLYTALVYGGLSLVRRIVQGLDALLERDGFANVAQAVGTRREAWL